MNEIKERLKRAVNRFPRPDMATLWDLPIHRMDEHDHITRQNPLQQQRVPPARRLITVMACLAVICLAGLGWYTQNGVVDAVVGLEVNPGFEITVNRRENVLSVKGLNAAALNILKDQDYHGQDVEDTVVALMHAVEGDAFLNESENTVLVSIRAANEEKSGALSQRLSQCIRETMDRPEHPTTVLRQSCSSQDEEDASPYGISAGRLRLIRTLAEESDQYAIEDLAPLSLEKLERLILKNHGATGVTVDRTIWVSSLSDLEEDDDVPVSTPSHLVPAPTPAPSSSDSWERDNDLDDDSHIYDIDDSSDDDTDDDSDGDSDNDSDDDSDDDSHDDDTDDDNDDHD